jgi:hypothetical protein
MNLVCSTPFMPDNCVKLMNWASTAPAATKENTSVCGFEGVGMFWRATTAEKTGQTTDTRRNPGLPHNKRTTTKRTYTPRLAAAKIALYTAIPYSPPGKFKPARQMWAQETQTYRRTGPKTQLVNSQHSSRERTIRQRKIECCYIQRDLGIVNQGDKCIVCGHVRGQIHAERDGLQPTQNPRHYRHCLGELTRRCH